MHSSLTEEITACTLCTDLPLGPRPIVQLSPKAKILIASQAPGRIAHESGIPFQDPSGRRLRRWMGMGMGMEMNEDAFYNPDHVAILPMGFCYPGKAGGGDAPPRKLCAQTWRQRGLEALRSIELVLIIGRHSLAWHFPYLKKEPLTKLAKTQPLKDALPDAHSLPSNTKQAFILPHPSPRNQIWQKRNPWFEADVVPQLQRAIKAL